MANLALANYRNYRNSDMYDIYDAYKNPSFAKTRAFRACADKCAEYGGENLKVVSKNCFIFTAGFEFCDDDGVVMFAYITPSYIYTCAVDDALNR